MSTYGLCARYSTSYAKPETWILFDLNRQLRIKIRNYIYIFFL